MYCSRVSFPAEFHAQTAVEAALELHGAVKDRLEDIERIVIETQEAGSRIIDKTGPLDNPADRDHCIQYMVAVPMIHGRLTARDYEDEIAQDPRIDALREKMEVRENPGFTVDYMDPDKRAIGNAVQVHFKDGGSTARVEVPYPIGHRRRRSEGVPLLQEKFERHVAAHLAPDQMRKHPEDVRVAGHPGGGSGERVSGRLGGGGQGLRETAVAPLHRPWTPAFQGGPKRQLRGTEGQYVIPAPPPSFPRKRESRGPGGGLRGVSPLHPAWIPAFAGMTIVGGRCLSRMVF